MNPDKKDTNPKDVIGSLKVPLHVVPAPVMMEEGLVFLAGGCKYGPYNFRASGVRASIYYDAIERHVMAWWEGEDFDPEDGIHHLSHVRACAAILRDADMRGVLVDDRPPKSASGWVAKMNAEAKRIIAMHPNPVPACTEKPL